MKRMPIKFKTEEKDCLLSLSSRVTKKGDLLYFVEYDNFSTGLRDYVAFSHLSSALDFINVNFK